MTISFYSIIQCVPDPLAEERVNIGVLVVAGENIHYRFLSNWKRAESFSKPSSLEITKSFRDELELICLRAKNLGQMRLSSNYRTPADTVRQMVSEWSNQVQFTELRPSMEDPLELVDRLAEQFLKQRVSAKREARSRNQIMFGTYRSLGNAISQMDPQEHRYLEAKLHPSAPGAIVQDLQVDVGLLNGQLRAATESVSFQTMDINEINFQWRESIYTLVDLKNQQRWVNTALVVAAPDDSGRLGSPWHLEFDAARKAADKNGIAVIDEERELEQWSAEQVMLALAAS